MTTNNPCPYCDNLPPYFLATITASKTLSMNKIIELTDKVAVLEKELYQLKKELNPLKEVTPNERF